MSEQGQIVRRSIGIVFDDGALLALTAARPKGGGGHDAERISAFFCDPEGEPVRFDESLLSTEYGEDGVQRRATLELWPDVEEARPVRGAGRLISAVSASREGLEARIAFFGWSVEGREGFGTYEVARLVDG